MILVDTSVWIDHLRSGDPLLSQLLSDRRIFMHPFVLGEIAMGSLKNRGGVLGGLAALPAALVAQDSEVLEFVSEHQLHGLGIGYIDAHLMASAKITPATSVWTRDTRLQKAAVRLAIAFRPRVN